MEGTSQGCRIGGSQISSPRSLAEQECVLRVHQQIELVLMAFSIPLWRGFCVGAGLSQARDRKSKISTLARINYLWRRWTAEMGI